MRCVPAFAADGAAHLSAEERAALEAVRHLATRFPLARLREVPLVRARELDAVGDPSGRTRVWLALEMLQVTGSFKVRGALVSLDANRSRGHVVAVGTGNHGLAVSYAAGVLNLMATICVSKAASRHHLARIEGYGAELVVSRSDRDEDAEALALEIAAARGAVFVSAHDDLDFVRGAGASLGFEIVRALGGVPERVLVPLGGGGLATGLAWGLAAEAGAAPAPIPEGRAERCVWGVQSRESCAMAASFELGRPVDGDARRHDGSRSSRAFARATSAIAGIVVASDAHITAAMTHAYRDMGLVVELRAAAALAPVLFGLPEPIRGGDLVVVLTGRNVEPGRFDDIRESASDAAH